MPIETINNTDTQKKDSVDVMGRIFEYFLSKIAVKGNKKGEFCALKNIVKLIT